MLWPGFCSGSYRPETSPNASPADLINWYPERLEKGPRAGQMRLRQIPGLSNFRLLPTSPMRALFAVDPNRLFAVAGNVLYEVFLTVNPPDPPIGYSPFVGPVAVGVNPAIIVAGSGSQVAIASGGLGFITGGGPVVPILDAPNPPGGPQLQSATMAFIDQYFVAGIQGTRQVRISNLAPNGQIWDPGDAANKEAYADNIQRVWVDQPGGELLWLFGQDTLEIWQDTGGLFPFGRISGAVFPIGCDSAWSVAGANGQRFWLWRGRVWGATGLQPQRVSDFGVEQAIQGYSAYDQQNAEAFCYIDRGHVFYVISFPLAGVTWAYDSTEKEWAKRLYWNNNQWGRYRPRVYAFQWGMHLVGDYNTGQIYQMDPTVYTDAGGVPLRRDFISTYITQEETNLRYNRLTLDMDTGVGLNVGPTVAGADPQIGMRYSPDRGKTWSNWRTASIGRIGETLRRVFWPQMGSSRIGMAVHGSITDPVLADINAAYIDISPSTYPRQGQGA